MIEIRINAWRGEFKLETQIECAARVTGVFGPSGSGKTTLLNCIAGSLSPEAGRIAVDGEVIFDAASGVNRPMRDRRIGYVFQDALLFPHMTVRANLLYGRTRSTEGPKLEQVASLLEIEPLLDRPPDELSGGEQRRVSVGRASMSNPRLLLLDEPLTGLDAALAARVLSRLKEVIERFAIPVLYVSHTVSDLLFLCDEVVVLKGGHVVTRGPARETLLRADVLSPAEWPELRNIFTGKVIERRKEGSSATALCQVGEAALTVFANERAGLNMTLSIRAADIVLSRERPAGLSARNVFRGVVRSIVESGDRRLVLLDAGAPWMVEVSAAAIRELGLKPGVQAHIIVKTSSISAS